MHLVLDLVWQIVFGTLIYCINLFSTSLSVNQTLLQEQLEPLSVLANHVHVTEQHREQFL